MVSPPRPPVVTPRGLFLANPSRFHDANRLRIEDGDRRGAAVVKGVRVDRRVIVVGIESRIFSRRRSIS